MGRSVAYPIRVAKVKQTCVQREGDSGVIRENVIAGIRPRMSSGDDWPQQLRDLTDRCWKQDPEDRPTFEGQYFECYLS